MVTLTCLCFIDLFTFFTGKSINLDPQKFTETELAVLLANHLFGKLATYNNYVIDKSFGRKGDEQCVCDDKTCKMTGHYGDTSVGKTNLIAFLRFSEVLCY